MYNSFFTPYIAEFWRRWHISLTTWFRDYVYIPLGGSRGTKWQVVRNTFIIFLISGFWHGANWTFIAWGAFHAVLFLPLILLGKNRKYTNTVAEGKIFPSIKEIFQMGLTFLLVVIGWVFFRADSIGQVFEYLGGMIQFGTLRASYRFFTQDWSSFGYVSYFILFMLIVEWVGRRKQHGLEIGNINVWLRRLIYLILIFCIIWFMGKNEQFIYFQF